MVQRRLIFDISTLANAIGYADGITRTFRELTSFAAATRQDIVIALYDLEIKALRPIRAEWVMPILQDAAKVETSHFPDRWSDRRRLRESFPYPLKQIARRIQRPRRQLFVWLERRRLRGTGFLNLAWLQRSITSEKYQRELTNKAGHRRTLIPYDMAVEKPLLLTPDDILVLAGSDWQAMHEQGVYLGSGAGSPRFVVLCYDIIPLLFPQFFPRKNVEMFRACFHALLPAADLVIFSANRILSDVRAYCEANRLNTGKTEVVRLGADFAPFAIGVNTALPSGLEPDRFALFVSTLEPRKGHRMLFSVWKRLLATGVPQANGFKLVFVGRRGWLVDDLLAELDEHPSVGDSLLLLSDVDDGLLHALYAQTAFCLYPSLYEGFGLPIIEGFRYGKAVLSSSGGALSETVGPFSPCLDPLDEDAWYAMMKQWIEDPAARAPFETAIKSGFHPRSWREAATEFFAVIDRELR